MSLDYDISTVKDCETVCFDDIDGRKRMKGRTFSLIHLMASIMLERITEENASEVLKRIIMYRHVQGHPNDYWIDDNTPMKYNLQDIRDHIGLKTNANDELYEYFIERRLVRTLEYHARNEMASK